MSEEKTFTTHMKSEDFIEYHNILRTASKNNKLSEWYATVRDHMMTENKEMDEENIYLAALVAIAHPYSGIETIEVSRLLEYVDEVRDIVLTELKEQNYALIKEKKSEGSILKLISSVIVLSAILLFIMLVFGMAFYSLVVFAMLSTLAGVLIIEDEMIKTGIVIQGLAFTIVLMQIISG